MSVHDPIDELAALFLTEPDSPQHGGGTTGETTIELLIVGHLPVRAGVWLSPYADALARTVGQSALLRLDDSAAQLQVFRGDTADVPWPRGQGTLRETMHVLHGSVGVWSIRPPHDAPEARLVRSGADRITILSSADQAAVVESYRLIKQLAAASRGAGCTLPKVSMAMLGCELDEGRRVVERLNETAVSFLETELEMVLCLPRMDAGMIPRGTRRFTAEPCPTVAEAIRWLSEVPATRQPQRPEPTITPDPVMESPAVDHTASPPHVTTAPRPPAPTPPRSPRRVAPVPGSRPFSAAASELLEEIAAVEHTAAPRSAPVAPAEPHAAQQPPQGGVAHEFETKQPCPPQEPDLDGRPMPLSAHVEGLSPLAARCPGHERVELAVDEQGRLHLLGREDLLRSMHVVQRWAFDHRELIAMACSGVEITQQHRPTLHLFTSRPVAVTDLHQSDIRLHVLAPVHVGDQVGWYAAPLN